MLRTLYDGLPFPVLLVALVAIGLVWYLAICGGLYLLLNRSRYSGRARRWKTQLRATRSDQVRGELVDGVLSMSMAMSCVAIAFWMSSRGIGQLYSSPHDHPLWQIPLGILGVFVVMEVFEWAFHWASHRNPLLWKLHKRHHRYANPTPLGVMADQPFDMLVKASPIVWIPMLFPVWDVALLVTFATMNFLYGTYLHAGFDPPWAPSPHSRFLVTAWHHNEHHSGSVDYNYGFFTGFMDILCGTRLTPADRVAREPSYRCPACRDPETSPAA